jgi:hypothetical protein
MTRAETKALYTIDARGIITSPGKFEGEACFVPHLWEACLNGEGLEVPDSLDAEYELKITDEDRKEWPELSRVYTAILYESFNGFVYCTCNPLYSESIPYHSEPSNG